ncbi:uncharacterized protein LMH87_007838 [Akanthomyces muscarius]|uniref:Uncharacterized protein n=1 Tax=Akanthomyces muscarius TaxID=2231603 RepID=A0A9W8UPR5_AKAMU|nr:uncharacterized protein LMH87_007838 [Akanthomyces muscarius]KAJ4159901.1 hypothetical protein LMH87_007838 [Akanthomyces muscarius]
MASNNEIISRRENFSKTHFRPSVDKISEGSGRHWYGIWSFAKTITSRYMNGNQPTAVLDIDLHDLWYKLIQVAKITPADEADADRIVAQVIRIRELGDLCRHAAPQDTNIDSQKDIRKEVAITSSGARMWTDLPFLVQDLRAAWTNSLYTMTTKECENLSGVTARLSGGNVCGARMTSCALILFQAALETQRPILQHDKPISDGVEEKIAVQDLMPAVFTWLYWGSYKIWQLCAREPFQVDAELDAMDEHWAEVGELATARGVMEVGFNRERMCFWMNRLKEIAEATQGKDDDFAEKCRWCANLLGQWDCTMGGRTAE